MDADIVLWVHRYTSHEILDVIFKTISSLGNHGMVWIVLAFFMLMMSRKRPKWAECALLMLISLGITALLVNVVMKPLAARIRPYEALQLLLIIPPPQDYSFPSGHTSAACAAAAVFWYENRRAGSIMWIFAVLMAFSRLYLSVHYPTDLLAGALIGTGVSISVIQLYTKILKLKR